MKENHGFNCESFVYNHLRFENFEFDGIEPQIHDIYELILVKQGELSYIIDDRKYYVKSNSLIFTRPGKRHIINFLSKEAYERYDILFDRKLVFPEVFEKIPRDIDVITLNKNYPIEEIFKKMDFYCENFSGEALKNILAGLIDEIFYNFMLLCENNHEKTLENKYDVNPLVSKAVRIIEENIGDDLCLDILCNKLFITKSYLNKLFNRYLRISPKKYIISKRLIAAQNKISEGAIPTSVYEECGFKEYSTFYRNYKDYFGYSPSEEPDMKIVRKIDI